MRFPILPTAKAGGFLGGVFMIIEHFALNVADPVAIAAWYVQHLGFQVVRHVDNTTQTHFLADSAG